MTLSRRQSCELSVRALFCVLFQVLLSLPNLRVVQQTIAVCLTHSFLSQGKLVPTKYDFEDIHMEVSPLGTRINSLPSDTTKDL